MTKLKALPANTVWLIDNDIVVACEYSDLNEKRTLVPSAILSPEEYYNAISRKAKYKSDILHKNCIFIKEENNDIQTIVYVYEYEPQIRSIHDIENERFYDISFPYVQFYAQFTTNPSFPPQLAISKLTCSHKPIQNMSDMVYKLPVYNLHFDESICWGDNPIEQSKKETLCNYGERLGREFFALPFNFDLTPKFPCDLVRGWSNWANSTKLDPNFILSVPFKRLGSFEKIIESL